MVLEFRNKTDKYFHKINGRSAEEIEEIVLEYINKLFEDNDISEEITILEIVLTGSRCRGLENENSDIDIAFEFKSEYWSEASLFNLLNEDIFKIDNIEFDINPITVDKTGSMEDYLSIVKSYLEGKRATDEKCFVFLF